MGAPISMSLRARIAGLAGDALSGALTSITGVSFQAGIAERRGTDKGESEKTGPDRSDPENAEGEKTDLALIWRQRFSVGADALFWLVAGKDIREAVGQMVHGGAGADAVSGENCLSTWNEIVSQTMSGMAMTISVDLGREVLAEVGEQAEEEPGEQEPDAVLEIRTGERIWRVRIAWSSRFADAFSPPAPQSEQPAFTSQAALGSRTLDLLLDVSLPVSISFGKTSLQIREVLKLNTGSVVELDRLVSDPVEVIVNNCVIARGEVVVVDGNYGVRVVQLASREDRLRSGMTEASARFGLAAK